MSDTYAYVALQEIWHGGVRAYNVGDFVPAANVAENDYEVGVQVARRDTEPTGPTGPTGDAPPPRADADPAEPTGTPAPAADPAMAEGGRRTRKTTTS